MPIKKINNHNAGFSLIEVLVVGSLSVMLMLTISTLFMTFLASSTVTNMRRTVDSEGSYALGQISFFLRNAISIDSACNGTTSSSILLTSVDNAQTLFLGESDDGVVKIASQSAAHNDHGGTLYLTNTEVDLVSGPSFVCTQNAGKKFVNVVFELQFKNGENTNQTFTTQVVARN
jgi:hypothetical protein